MTQHRILCVYGTRPEAVKMAPVVLAARRHPEVTPVVCITGQHREMLDQINRYFGIIPEIDLNLMTTGQTLPELTARCLTALSVTISEQQPDCVIAQGDTTTAMCAAVAAFYGKIPFVHVEAGLRTNHMDSPFPEEFNRRVCSLTAWLHCAPTENARGNLLREGYGPRDVVVTGNTVLDALHFTVRRERTNHDLWIVKHAAFAGQPLVLITAHRRENHGTGIRQLCLAIERLARHFENVQFVYPVHPNPEIRGPVHDLLSHRPNVHLIPPADYPEFVWLMDQSTLILSDSGGVQEEAPSLGKPVLVTRDNTERPEALEAGATRLIGTDPDRVFQEVSRLLTDRSAYHAMQIDGNPYGDGRAGERIVALCLSRLRARSGTLATS